MKTLLASLSLILFTAFLYAQDMDVYNNCPMVGRVSASNSPARRAELEALNQLKNRYHLPREEEFDPNVTIEAMLGEDGEQDRDKFDVNRAATIEGYVIYAAKKGSAETCNCKSTSTYFTDQHIEIAVSPDERKDERTITVEITPRLREIMSEQGVDWTHSEIRNLVGRKIRVSGWLFYDNEHEKDACSYNPEKCRDVPGYNRHTCWEIHPVTYLEDITDEVDMLEADVDNGSDEDRGNVSYAAYHTGPPSTPYYSPNKKTKSMDATQFLILVLLGGILGIVGQLLRVIVGLKKASDTNEATDYKRTVLSLVLAFAVGGVAGVLASVNSFDAATFDKSTVLAFLAAGYAGTDFIEGFMRKNQTELEKSKPQGELP